LLAFHVVELKVFLLYPTAAAGAGIEPPLELLLEPPLDEEAPLLLELPDDDEDDALPLEDDDPLPELLDEPDELLLELPVGSVVATQTPPFHTHQPLLAFAR
jgi:hypothetical protein